MHIENYMSVLAIDDEADRRELEGILYPPECPTCLNPLERGKLACDTCFSRWPEEVDNEELEDYWDIDGVQIIPDRLAALVFFRNHGAEFYTEVHAEGKLYWQRGRHIVNRTGRYLIVLQCEADIRAAKEFDKQREGETDE